MNRFGNNPRQGDVPLETARKIARQRDKFAEQVQQLRRNNEQLQQLRREAEDKIEELEEYAARLEDRIDELEAELDSREEPEETAEDDQRESGEKSERVQRLERRVASLTDDLNRVRDRADSSAAQARREERVRLLSELGGLIDSLERGLSMIDDSSERAGLEGIYAQLRKFLQSEGASLTGESGERLDPHRHEAVNVVEDTDRPSGEIVDVLRPGIALDDGTVVLPARVSVAA